MKCKIILILIVMISSLIYGEETTDEFAIISKLTPEISENYLSTPTCLKIELLFHLRQFEFVETNYESIKNLMIIDPAKIGESPYMDYYVSFFWYMQMLLLQEDYDKLIIELEDFQFMMTSQNEWANYYKEVMHPLNEIIISFCHAQMNDMKSDQEIRNIIFSYSKKDSFLNLDDESKLWLCFLQTTITDEDSLALHNLKWVNNTRDNIVQFRKIILHTWILAKSDIVSAIKYLENNYVMLYEEYAEDLEEKTTTTYVSYASHFENMRLFLAYLYYKIGNKSIALNYLSLAHNEQSTFLGNWEEWLSNRYYFFLDNKEVLLNLKKSYLSKLD